MAEFIPFDTNTEILGYGIQAVVDVLGSSAYPALEKYNLRNFELEQWYPQASILKVFHDWYNQGTFNMVLFGMQIPHVIKLPPVETPIAELFPVINDFYQQHHRNGYAGEYRYEATSEHSGVLKAHSPYPSDFDYGIIYQIVKKYRPISSQQFSVVREKSPAHKDSANHFIYTLQW